MQSLYLSVGAALFGTVVLALLLRPVARSFDFIDKPGGRKQHAGEVPIIGGIAMFVGLSLGLSLLPETARPPAGFTATAFGFVCLGLLDDRLNLPSIFRLLVQLGAVLLMIFVGGLGVYYVGAPFGAGTVIFEPWVAVIVTSMLVVGAVNALNMIDGIDGLAGSMGLLGLIAVAGVGLFGGNTPVFSVAVVLAGAVIGFLLFNLPLGLNERTRIFMGDAGSMLLGFSLAWTMVALSQEPETPVEPVTLLWFATIPIFDMVSTAVGRIFRGQSPMSADNTHLHHWLLKKGLTVRLSLLVLIGFALIWATVGLFLDLVADVPEWLSLLAFVAAGLVTVAVIQKLPQSRSA